MPSSKNTFYTSEDYWKLPEDRRAELIDGQLYDMAPPEYLHQKLFKYRTAGVREYWIVNPATRTVNVYDFEKETGTAQYTFDDRIPACIYPDLSVGIADLL